MCVVLVHIILSVPLFVSVKFHEDHKTHKVEVKVATLGFGDIAEFKTVVPICLSL